LEALSPLQVLERGYALVFDSNGRLVKNAAQVSAGEVVQAQVAHGKIKAAVTEVEG
jgi:exodeoxyribonuclease VII large subunit